MFLNRSASIGNSVCILRFFAFAAALHFLIAAGCMPESGDASPPPSPARAPESVSAASPDVSESSPTPTQPPATATSSPTGAPTVTHDGAAKSPTLRAAPTATPRPTHTPIPPKPVLSTPTPEPVPTPANVPQSSTPAPATPRWEQLRFVEVFNGARFRGDEGRPLDMLPWPGGGMAVLSRPGMITLLHEGARRTLLNLLDATQQDGPRMVS